jgi:3-phosphoshikimate 1-carboxyvinyltransferase
MNMRVRPPKRLVGRVEVPGDKSISHRAALMGAIAGGRTEITGFLEGEDCLHTLKALEQLGAAVTRKGPGHYLVDGVGPGGFHEADDIIDCGNSGTMARLLLGVLAGQPFWTFLTGDDSMRSRPMKRVADPLSSMGATFVGRQDASRLPLGVRGARPLRALSYVSPVASAQVKTALLLAGLWADGPVSVTEPTRSRDHTERMLGGFGARLSVDDRTVTLTPGAELRGQGLAVPGDISSAAFLVVAGTIVAGAEITVSGVGVNETRAGLFDALESMGAPVGLSRLAKAAGEPVADLTARSSTLRGTTIGGAMIPRLVDEVPVLALAACLAEGRTRITDAAELRVKESDRIRSTAAQLAKLGARVTETPDGLEIEGVARLRGARVQSGGDHRMAMALVVAGLVAEGETIVEDTDCIGTSFPGFLETVNALAGAPCVEVLP